MLMPTCWEAAPAIALIATAVSPDPAQIRPPSTNEKLPEEVKVCVPDVGPVSVNVMESTIPRYSVNRDVVTELLKVTDPVAEYTV